MRSRTAADSRILGGRQWQLHGLEVAKELCMTVPMTCGWPGDIRNFQMNRKHWAFIE